MELIIFSIVFAGLAVLAAILYNHYVPIYKAKKLAEQEQERLFLERQREAEVLEHQKWQAQQIDLAKAKAVKKAETDKLKLEQSFVNQKKSPQRVSTPQLMRDQKVLRETNLMLSEVERRKQKELQYQKMMNQRKIPLEEFFGLKHQQVMTNQETVKVRINPLTGLWESEDPQHDEKIQEILNLMQRK